MRICYALEHETEPATSAAAAPPGGGSTEAEAVILCPTWAPEDAGGVDAEISEPDAGKAPRPPRRPPAAPIRPTGDALVRHLPRRVARS